MVRKDNPSYPPLPRDFLAWQVALRAHTMAERNGAPHVGVAPLVTVRQVGSPLAVSTHSIICGLLPRQDLLAAKTAEFRGLYESTKSKGSRTTYDAGIEYLKGYYQSAEVFDPDTITTLVGKDSPVGVALAADPRCHLLFYVFNLSQASQGDQVSELDRFRCLELHCRAELHASGPVYDNVWWHNTLFHGKADGCLVVRFRHLATFDTRFGRLEAVA